MKTFVAISFLMTLMSSIAAQETGNRDDSAAVFKRLDRNGDGKVTAEEAARVPALARFFSVIDADSDGMLTMEEIRTGFRRGEDRPRRAAAPLDPNVSQAEHTLTIDGRDRMYVTQAPKNPKGKLPVVFFFHGGGGSGESLAARGFREIVAKENFLAVYPSGWKNNWNDGRNAARIVSQQEGVDDVKFVRAIVDDVDKRHSIDRSRIFATGVSNGGIFSHYLAAKAADLFAGVAPVVGGLAEPLADGFKPSHPISLLVIQGDADPAVPIGGGPISRDDRRGSVIPTEDMLKLYLARNGVTGAPEIEKLPDTDPNDGTTTEVRRYPPGTGGVCVEYYLVKGGGHAMPGIARGGQREWMLGRTSRDFDGLKTIWEFFRACPPRMGRSDNNPATPASPKASDGNDTVSDQRQSHLDRVRWLYRNLKPKEHKEEIAEQRSGEPPLKRMPDGDPARDASGRGQLFESICVPGVTDLQEGMNGVAIVDLDKDGRLDIVATYSPPRVTGGRSDAGEKLRVFINEGDFTFREHTIRILDSKLSPAAFGRGQVPVLADFNGDGFLDLFVTRNAQMSGGQSFPDDQKTGNGLYISDGAWDVFRDVSAKMAIQNEKAYNRQPSIGDVNRDGWLDIAIGCDNIKNAIGGFPHNRLYVFKPRGPKFEDGRFEDIGGTDLVPDFGGFYHDSAKDKAGPDINLRDLDNDGDLDLIQSYHVDVLELSAPYTPVEYRQGVFCWKNLLVENGESRFEKISGNGLACEMHLKLNATKSGLEPVGKAPGLPYVSLADVDNDGLLDVLAVGPASPGRIPRAEYVGGRFWRNKGGFRFEEATGAAGMSALDWVYRDWFRFLEMSSPKARPGARIQPGNRGPYYADAIFGDFNNDGWMDLVVQDRYESPSFQARAILFMNRGNGTFEPKPTTFSGLDGIGVCGEAADLNNDGLLDLLFAADPDNSGVALSMSGYESKVYWNTGEHGGKANHWLHLTFTGLKDAELIGARIELLECGDLSPLSLSPNSASESASTDPLGGSSPREIQSGEKPPHSKKQYRWLHTNHSYKSGGQLDAHFGLGAAAVADVKVTLLDGQTKTFRTLAADQSHSLHWDSAQ